MFPHIVKYNDRFCNVQGLSTTATALVLTLTCEFLAVTMSPSSDGSSIRSWIDKAGIHAKKLTHFDVKKTCKKQDIASFMK